MTMDINNLELDDLESMDAAEPAGGMAVRGGSARSLRRKYSGRAAALPGGSRLGIRAGRRLAAAAQTRAGTSGRLVRRILRTGSRLLPEPAGKTPAL